MSKKPKTRTSAPASRAVSRGTDLAPSRRGRWVALAAAGVLTLGWLGNHFDSASATTSPDTAPVVSTSQAAPRPDLADMRPCRSASQTGWCLANGHARFIDPEIAVSPTVTVHPGQVVVVASH